MAPPVESRRADLGVSARALFARLPGAERRSATAGRPARPDQSTHEARVRALGIGLSVAALGAIAVTGVGFLTTDVRLLSWVHSSPPIRVNVALGMGLLAGSLLVWAAGEGRSRRVAPVLSLLAASIGFATLVEYMGVDLGIDRLLFHPPAGLPSRPALNSALMLVILGCAAALLSPSSRSVQARRVMHVLAVAGTVVGLLGMIGYATGETSLYTLGSGKAWAFPSILGDLLVALALLALRSDVGVMRILVAPGPGGRIARILLPAAILAPIAGQAASEAGTASGVYSTRFGDWLVAVLVCTLLAVAVLLIAARIEALDRMRDRSEAELQASEERYRGLVEGARDGIFTANLDGRFTAVNPAAERIVGFDRTELLTMNFFDLVPSEERERIQARLVRALAADTDETVEVPVVTKSGTEVTVEVSGRVVVENGQPARIEGIARDTTERRALEAQYLQAQKMETVGRLAGGVAHDFNNLLTAIFGYIDFAFRRIPAGDTELRSDLEQVRAASERARDLSKQLLAFSRRSAIAPRVVSLSEVVAETVPLIERLLGETIEVAYRAGADVGYCLADPASINQVLLNFAVNARDAMPDGGTIEIVTGKTVVDTGRGEVGLAPGEYLTLAFADTGTGIDADVLDDIFEPFFTTKPVGKGTGLGLSTVHGIVHQLGGTVAVASTVGRGSTFTVYLPVCDPSAVPDRAADEVEPVAAATDARAILLVEDEAVVRKLLTRTLRRQGYAVSEASTPTEAVALATQNDFDVLVTDVIMPERSGISLAAELRESVNDLSVVFMSGYSTDVVEDSTLVEGPRTRFLQKPFTTDELLLTLSSLESAEAA